MTTVEDDIRRVLSGTCPRNQSAEVEEANARSRSQVRSSHSLAHIRGAGWRAHTGALRLGLHVRRSSPTTRTSSTARRTSSTTPRHPCSSKPRCAVSRAHSLPRQAPCPSALGPRRAARPRTSAWWSRPSRRTTCGGARYVLARYGARARVVAARSVAHPKRARLFRKSS